MPIDRSIRVKAFAVILDDEARHHAVSRMRTAEHPAFHRPLGGSVELGERSADAVVREVREELGATLVEPDAVPVTGRPFMDLEEEGWVEWRSLDGDDELPLFPEGLQELIDGWRGVPARRAGTAHP